MNKHGSNWIWRPRRLAIYARDNYTCTLCQRDLSNVPNNVRTLDHIVPRSKGGTHHSDNLRTMCVSCNSKKGAK